MKKLAAASLLTLLLLKTGPAFAQEHPRVPGFLLFAGGSFIDDEVLKPGFDAGIGYEWPVSSSFTLGANFLYQRHERKDIEQAYKPYSLRFALKYFPYKLLNKIVSTARFPADLYFKSEGGISRDKVEKYRSTNLYSAGIGYQFHTQGNNMITVDVGVNEINMQRLNNTDVAASGAIVNVSYFLGKK
ncbi:hypothetical protein [Hufsiella ginkgonis]|uniref:Outer membrane beta-barrel protein n=1 Tax=Hufsiella ginkgonis TaxID=2695274 RepID=A0A7K1Y3K6_9SPHI|nr:hypothetical protein [Hufsiella ginkgonis]MXV17698.1 hypothetical protein [Hufsiella ginkgonis]